MQQHAHLRARNYARTDTARTHARTHAHTHCIFNLHIRLVWRYKKRKGEWSKCWSAPGLEFLVSEQYLPPCLHILKDKTARQRINQSGPRNTSLVYINSPSLSLSLSPPLYRRPRGLTEANPHAVCNGERGQPGSTQTQAGPCRGKYWDRIHAFMIKRQKQTHMDFWFASCLLFFPPALQ